jgi:hypothetical protein
MPVLPHVAQEMSKQQISIASVSSVQHCSRGKAREGHTGNDVPVVADNARECVIMENCTAALKTSHQVARSPGGNMTLDSHQFDARTYREVRAWVVVHNGRHSPRAPKGSENADFSSRPYHLTAGMATSRLDRAYKQYNIACWGQAVYTTLAGPASCVVLDQGHE